MSYLMKLSICILVACLALTACSDSNSNPKPSSDGGGGAGGGGGSGSKNPAGCLALVGTWECTDLENGEKDPVTFAIENGSLTIKNPVSTLFLIPNHMI